MPEIDLSRDSPFGPFSQISARRTFAYLIATLNASHPDYEFSNALRPLDFRKTSGTTIRRATDSALLNMRPRRMALSLAPPARSPYSSSAPLASPTPEVMWNERMWELIDLEMDLRHCEKYSWEPEDDPFEEEGGALWGQHHFFFNKDKKRVCYLHFRAFSVISHSPAATALPFRGSTLMRSINNVTVGDGAEKRAQYWLGHSIDNDNLDSSWTEDDDLVMDVDGVDDTCEFGGDEYEGEYTDDLGDFRDHLEDGYYAEGDFLESDDATGWGSRSKFSPRGSSEGVMDAMEL